MRKHFFIIALVLLCGSFAKAQTKPSPETPPRPKQAAQPSQSSFDLSGYGVKIQPDVRLLVVMAALDAAGFDPVPQGEKPSAFRAQLRRDQADLDEDLRARLRRFYEGHRLHQENNTPPTAAEQASRYVSLAYALGPSPTFESPTRTDDLPGGLLEVLDFAPLVREFYRKSGIEERIPGYMRSYVAAGDELRQGTAEMVRAVLSYLHTRPQTNIIERVPVPKSGEQKKNAPQVYTTRDRERRFFIVPDLLAVPGTINFRVIGDDYYVVVPYGTNPASSELRRAYLQYVIDPLILRYNREIAERRVALKTLIEDVAKASGKTFSPDVFLTISRSFVTAVDIRLDELTKLNALSRRTQTQLTQTSDAAKRAAIVKESQSEQAVINDEAIAQLADAYERGAVLAFYFTEQLRGTETSGFDVTSSFADMIASFDPARETRRIAENTAARNRGLATQKARRDARDAQRTASGGNEGDETTPHAALLKKLIEVDGLLRLRNYTEAESRLKSLLLEFPGEARIFFALGETASLSAREAIDEEVRDKRLNDALVNYRNAVNSTSAETDAGLLSRAHQAMGSILAFLERNDEALKEFDAAIKIGRDVPNNAYDKAVEGKKRLMEPK